MKRERLTVPVDIPTDSVVKALTDHGDYRVATRITPMVRRSSWRGLDGQLTACVLDVETTGLDPERDRITELALQTVTIGENGHIVQTSVPRSWMEDPGFPIPPDVSKITGITDEMVRGRSVSNGEAYGRVAGADVIISHNAAFDRPFVDRRLELGGQAWICSLNDIDWASYGFSGRSLADLLLKCGWFFDGAHRASADVNALLYLLDHELDGGETVAKILFRNALQPTWEIFATGAPFGKKELLKSRGYRWDPKRKVWRFATPASDPAPEIEWLSSEIYGGRNGADLLRVSWRERYV